MTAEPTTVSGDVAERAQRVRLVVTDVDGVWTDGGMYYSEGGDELKRFNTRDGMGVELLRAAGVPVVVITRETSEAVVRRAAKLGLSGSTFVGVKDKAAKLREIASELGLEHAQIAFIGDDVNDIEAMGLCGLRVTVADGMPMVKDHANYVCSLRGGNGAFRELADLIIAAQGPPAGKGPS